MLVGLDLVRSATIKKDRAFYARSLRQGLNLTVAGLLRANRQREVEFPNLDQHNLKRFCVQVSTPLLVAHSLDWC